MTTRDKFIEHLRSVGSVGATYAEISAALNVSRSAIQDHAKRMRDAGLICRLTTYRPDGAAVVALTEFAVDAAPDTGHWFPSGALLQVHNVLQAARRSNAKYVSVDYITERVDCTRDSVNRALNDLHQRGYCHVKRGGRSLKARGKAPSELPAAGSNSCELCFARLDGRKSVCRKCLPVDVHTPHTRLQRGSEMKVRFLTERYAAGLPLWD